MDNRIKIIYSFTNFYNNVLKCINNLKYKPKEHFNYLNFLNSLFQMLVFEYNNNNPEKIKLTREDVIDLLQQNFYLDDESLLDMMDIIYNEFINLHLTLSEFFGYKIDSFIILNNDTLIITYINEPI